MAERHWAADPIEVVLQRAHPNEVSKDEILEETGLEAEELREGLDSLRELGKLNENGEGFALFMEGEDADHVPAPAADEEDEDAGEGDLEAEHERRQKTAAAAPALSAPGSGPSYRANFALAAAFAGARGESRDEVAWRDAQALEVRIADVLAEHLGVGVSVELETVDAYDAPRRLDPPVEGEGEDE